jgi:hypothetical protein
MQHYRDIQLIRTVEVCTPHGWCSIPFISLKEGDVFRLTETRIGEQDNRAMPGVWRALALPRPTRNQGLATIGIECEPYDERKFGDT